MFGNLAHMIPAASAASGPPKDVPPPTPINFPQCYPQDQDDEALALASGRPSKHLTAVLQGIIRPTEVTISHLVALGTHVIPNSALADLIPDAAFIPDFAAWHALSPDEVHAKNESTRQKLNTGNLSPGCQAYLERRRELSISNELAYRAVRRIPAPKGQGQARLGNSFEFYRHLELLSTFWDDTSKPTPPSVKSDEDKNEDGSGDATATEEPKASEKDPSDVAFYRSGAGHQMPPEYRQNIVTAFLKLVAYDYGCNVSAPRVEPRLYITSSSSLATASRRSYFSSGCTFIFRTPMTREAARAGIVEGPIAAVSARHTTTFPPLRPAPPTPDSTSPVVASPPTGTDRDSTMDLARELIAALVTAQHRAREGRTEKRIGEDAWWATKPRWGGGPGGPIGREVEAQSGADETIGDKDAPPPPPAEAATPDAPAAPVAALPRRPFSRPSSLMSSSSASGSAKGAKRLKKSGNLPMYDNYRMVRPPAATWDRKTQYTAIGRVPGADYDDVYVISALFHHVSVVRVRVPDKLLAVLDGEPDEPPADGEKAGSKSWGRLEVRRSPWYDLFKVEDRVAAMQLVWSMMAFLMRDVEGEKAAAAAAEAEGQDDVKMTDA
ncbi:hypothetical protein B0H67DRAFT_568786 [Lasiosphaeris hirsuta]|uniref:Uncharacterized protein n=1 Tax=Lasiosphaeris hirsuta TaxID=260670 RepID=A0AA40E4J3_9PEZI|nr:hypothetical protein B0H67DRAFT_568786 [Lasiosphaeris hirsuta]